MKNVARLEKDIETIIINQVQELMRPDLYRAPIVAFSSAADEKYSKLKEIIGDWHVDPTEFLPSARSVISYFIPFTKVVAEAPKSTKDGAFIWAEAYEIINNHFKCINQSVVDFLNAKSFGATSVIVSYDHNTYKTSWSHKSAAAIAGLDSFGANRILITAKGSAGRCGTIITTAELSPNSKPAAPLCLYVKNGSCGLCFDICPVKALGPSSFDEPACNNELSKNEVILRKTSSLQHVGVCGKCISICPVSYIE